MTARNKNDLIAQFATLLGDLVDSTLNKTDAGTVTVGTPAILIKRDI